MSYGEDVQIGFALQDSYGTANTSSLFWVPVLSESIALTKEVKQSGGMRGIYDESAAFEGFNSIEGDIEFDAHPVLVGAILQSILSESVVASGAIFTHTLKPRTADFDSSFCFGRPFTISKNMADGGSAQLFSDLNATALELTVSNGELVKCKLSVMGGTWAQLSAPAASYLAEDYWEWDTTSLTIGGAAVDDVRDLTIKINEPLTNLYTVGSGKKTPTKTKRSGFRTIEVNGTIIFNDQTEFQQFISQSERSMILAILGNTDIQSGYVNTLKFDAPAFRYGDFPLNAGGPGQTEISFSGKAQYSPGSATSAEFTLINTHAAY